MTYAGFCKVFFWLNVLGLVSAVVNFAAEPSGDGFYRIGFHFLAAGYFHDQAEPSTEAKARKKAA